MLPRVDWDRSPIEAVADGLAVHRNLYGHDVLPGPILREKDDGRDRRIQIPDAKLTSLSHLFGTSRRGTRERLVARLPELVIATELDRALVGGKAL